MSATFSWRRAAIVVAVLVAAVTISFFLGSSRGERRSEERLVAVSWGDGKYGPAFYGAFVFLEPDAPGFRVRARVAIGRGNAMFHDCGEIGRALSEAEAVARFGTVTWEPGGVAIGTGPGRYFLPRAELEKHR